VRDAGADDHAAGRAGFAGGEGLGWQGGGFAVGEEGKSEEGSMCVMSGFRVEVDRQDGSRCDWCVEQDANA